MSESRSIEVNNESDVIVARLQTRQMAKDAGLSIMDQARISLAVSSLANVIRLGDMYKGQIILNCIAEMKRKGVQVIWKMGADCDIQTITNNLNNKALNAMVHEMDVQISQTSGICITAVMWTPPPTRILWEEVS